MIQAGIDLGVEYTKAVILKNGELAGRAIVPTGGMDRPQQARKAYEAALAEAGVTAGDVEAVGTTGKGKYDIDFASKRMTETIAAAHAAGRLCPEATAFMSFGADEVLAAALGGDRLVSEYAMNQKCSAGLGIFLGTLAERLGLTIEQAGELCVPARGGMNEGCMVFAELDALSMMNQCVEPMEIMATASVAAGVRAANVMNDLTNPTNSCVVALGGLTKNKLFIKTLENELGLRFVIPEAAEYAGAIGAAIGSVKGINR